MSKITEVTIETKVSDILANPRHYQSRYPSFSNISTKLGDECPIRCSFFKNSIEVGVVDNTKLCVNPMEFHRRSLVNDNKFNVSFIVPTGVGASTGGHAGDANVALKLIASISDTVFTHPNVVNASDLNEIPKNCYYIEGSILSRFLMGTIGLRHKTLNNILVILGEHPDKKYMHAAYNSINAARAIYGTQISDVIEIKELKMEISMTPSGRASGIIEGLDSVTDALQSYRHEYDAIAISSPMDMGVEAIKKYYNDHQDRVNPIGGVEALLTHWLSYNTNVNSAHSPMMENIEMDNMDFGIVDSRLSAELISTAYFMCVLKGLMQSPTVVFPDMISKDDYNRPYPFVHYYPNNTMTAADVNAIVIPKGCLGLPIFAALWQGMPVIAVEDNIQVEDATDTIRDMPWNRNQYIEVNNYLEAIGVLTSMREGVSLETAKRPLSTINNKKIIKNN